MTTINVWNATVIPLIGTLMTIALYFAPWTPIHELKDTPETYQHFNGWTCIAMFFEAAMWFIYGFFANNVWLLPAEVFGIMLGLYYSIVWYACIPHRDKLKWHAELALIAVALFVMLFSASVFFGVSDPSQQTYIFGVATQIVTILFAAVPLAIPKHIPWLFPVMFIANGLFWGFFGVYKSDLNLIIPSFASSGLGLVQLCFNIYFVVHPLPPLPEHQHAHTKHPRKSLPARHQIYNTGIRDRYRGP